jgi:uncharacterized OsmC-like protein
MRSVISHRVTGYACRVEVRQFELKVDEPVDEGGADTGPRPTELLLAAVASCFTIAIAHVAKKHGRELNGLSVVATGEYDGPRFSRIHARARAAIGRDDLAWLLERAARVCYVSNSLGCEFTYSTD